MLNHRLQVWYERITIVVVIRLYEGRIICAQEAMWQLILSLFQYTHGANAVISISLEIIGAFLWLLLSVKYC